MTNEMKLIYEAGYIHGLVDGIIEGIDFTENIEQELIEAIRLYKQSKGREDDGPISTW